MVRAVLAHGPEQRTGKGPVTMAVTADDEQVGIGGLVSFLTDRRQPRVAWDGYFLSFASPSFSCKTSM